MLPVDQRPVARRTCACPRCSCPIPLSTAGTEVVVYCPTCAASLYIVDLDPKD
jgi:hypothetical protein